MNGNDKPEALRQSQSLPAGAVSSDEATRRVPILKAYRDKMRAKYGTVMEKIDFGLDELAAMSFAIEVLDGPEDALQADAREKGEAGWLPIESAPEVKGEYFWCVLAWGPEDDQTVGDGFRWRGKWYAAAVFHRFGDQRQFAWRECEVKPTHWRPRHETPATHPAQASEQPQHCPVCKFTMSGLPYCPNCRKYTKAELNAEYARGRADGWDAKPVGAEAVAKPIGEVVEGFSDGLGASVNVAKWKGPQPAIGTKLYTHPQPVTPAGGEVDVDALAQEIRRVDGRHSLGAGALAEALMPFLASAHPPVADAAPVAVIGSNWSLLFVGAEPIARIAERHGLRIGDALYAKQVGSSDPGVVLDAARYRFIREPNYGRWGLVKDWCGKDLDAAIDAAMNQRGGGV